MAQTDTLTTARSLGEQGRPVAALHLLRTYAAAHPGDLNTLWLEARMAYWALHFEEADRLYTEAEQRFPANLALQLDHAAMLVDLGREEQARPLLDRFAAWAPNDAALLRAQARACFWQGDHTQALALIDRALSADPHNAEAIALRNDIARAVAPWTQLGAAYTTDDQRLPVLDPMLGSGLYLGRLADLSLGVHAPRYMPASGDKDALWVHAGDRLTFRRQRLSVGLSAGVFQHAFDHSTTFTGAVDVERTVLRYLAVRVNAEHRPYTSTLASLDTTLMVDHLGASLTWTHPGTITGAVSWSVDRFADDNAVRTFYAWVLAPPVLLHGTELRLGYSYAFSDADADRYRAQLNTADAWTSGMITAQRYLYFTPHDQQVHAALVSWRTRAAAKVRLGVNASIGLKADANTPYFYADRAPDGSPVLQKALAPVTFSPYSVGADASFRLGARTSVRVDYAHVRSNFYTSDHASIGFTYHFIHGRTPAQ